MSAPNFRGIVVIDVGASNVRAILYDPELRERDSRVMTAPSRIGQHYT
jgi:sugar (pentulose or hexulose) kinase